MGRPICQDSSGAMSSRIASMASTAAEQNFARSAMESSAHCTCALRAAASAAVISAGDAGRLRATSRPSTGEIQTISGISVLVALEAAHQFPVGDAAVIFELLPFRGMHVVLDHGIAKRRAQHL